jgi:hypothetical protein
LLGFAYALEQATKARKAPQYKPSVHEEPGASR